MALKLCDLGESRGPKPPPGVWGYLGSGRGEGWALPVVSIASPTRGQALPPGRQVRVQVSLSVRTGTDQEWDCHGVRDSKEQPSRFSREAQDLLGEREQVHRQVLHPAVLCTLLLAGLHRLHPGQVRAAPPSKREGLLFLIVKVTHAQNRRGRAADGCGGNPQLPESAGLPSAPPRRPRV